MDFRYVKSAFWLVTFTGLGYTLLTAFSPSPSYVDEVKKKYSTNSAEKQTKNQQFVNVLKAASSSKEPLYRMSKEELEKSLKKN